MTTTRRSTRLGSNAPLSNTRPSNLPLASLLVGLAALGFAPAGCGGSKAASDGGSGHGGGGSGGSAGTPADGGGGTAGGTPDGGGDTTMACAEGGMGMLVVSVMGLPAGATMPMLRLSGPKLATPMMLTVGTPATVPAGGGYELQYRRVKVAPAGGAVVGKAFYVSSNSFGGCVKASDTTTAMLMYSQEPGSEHLWIGVSNAPTLGNEIAGFASADIAATADQNPTIWKMNHFVGRPGAGAFDSSGNFWVPGGDVVNAYKMLKLAMPGDVAPDVVITQPASSPAVFAAFDSDGHLWVSQGAPANKIVRYTISDPIDMAAPVQDVVVSSPDLVNPQGIAFDAAHGDLWVACEGNDSVVSFHRERLGAAYTGAADVALTAKTGAGAAVAFSYTAPTGIAFDQAGNLWVGFQDHLVGFTPAQQAASALVAGPLDLAISTGTGGFAFDESGGVWISGGNPSIFRRIPKAMLAASGTPTPDITITSSDLGYAESLVLDPSPTWSPLQDWL